MYFQFNDNNKIYPLRLNQKDTQKSIDLFLFSKDEKQHYSLIKNFSRLVRSQITSDTSRKLHICKKCLTHFVKLDLFEKHITYCSQNETVAVKMPIKNSFFLIEGLRVGFSIPFFGERSSRESRNLKSVIDNPAVVRAKLGKELEAGRIVGPFLTPPFPVFRTSPLGVVPKKTPNEFRLIHHLSYLSEASVNDFIPKEFSRFAMLPLMMPFLSLKNWVLGVTWPRQTFSLLFVSFQFTRKIIRYSEYTGRGVIILTVYCQWV